MRKQTEHRREPDLSRDHRPEIARLTVVGALCGLAWAAALRAYMAEINRQLSDVTWTGTFVGVLLPGALAGAALGAASAIEPVGRGRAALRSCAMAPLAFAVVPMLLPGMLASLLATGLGGGAVGVALGGLSGGYALGGRRLVARLAAGAIWLVMTLGVVMSVPGIGGPDLAVGQPRGTWVMVLAGSLLVVLGLAAAIPFRRLNASVSMSLPATNSVPDRARPALPGSDPA